MVGAGLHCENKEVQPAIDLWLGKMEPSSRRYFRFKARK